MCHRLLFGTTGTMANVPLTNNGTNNPPFHNVKSIIFKEISMIDYLASSRWSRSHTESFATSICRVQITKYSIKSLSTE